MPRVPQNRKERATPTYTISRDIRESIDIEANNAQEAFNKAMEADYPWNLDSFLDSYQIFNGDRITEENWTPSHNGT